MVGITIAFDLDGTLVDTAPDLIRATNHTLSLENLPAVAPASILPWVSFGAWRMIEHGLAANRVTRTEVEIRGMLERFLAYYADNIAVESRPFELIPELLQRLDAHRVLLVVCTNKQEALSRALLKQLGLAKWFRTVAGRDTYPVCKPDPGHLVNVVADAGGDIGRAIMVGDSETDVLTARAAGVPIIGVSFGYTDVPMRELNPDVVIDHYSEFERALATLLPRIESGSRASDR
jgi:phosphoglycolate phosphatase